MSLDRIRSVLCHQIAIESIDLHYSPHLSVILEILRHPLGMDAEVAPSADESVVEQIDDELARQTTAVVLAEGIRHCML